MNQVKNSPILFIILGIAAIGFSIYSFTKQSAFQDNSVDAAVCIRLSQHLPAHEQREDLLAELLRVARRYVVMTFFDYHSIKNILRRLRKSYPKLTMTVSQISSIAALHGSKLTACPRLSIIGSGHRYALIAKTASS